MTVTQTVTDQLGAAVHQNARLSRDGLLERLFSRLFRGLVYAQIWEDPVVDMQALHLTPEDNVICIASGGCNVMSYLTAQPASITAVDLSPAHVMLNKVKLTAARQLPDHAAFYDMFGHADRAHNIKLFDTYVAPALDADTRAYWNGWTLRGPRKRMLAKGLYRFGLLGRFLGAVHLVARVAGVDFRPLLAATTLDEQRRFFDEEIAPLFASGFVRFLARRRASLFGLGIPPAQYDKLASDAGGDVIPVLHDRTRKLFCDFPISRNYFAWQAAHRGYDPSGTGPVPPYLQPENFDIVRDNVARVQVLNKSLTDVLANQPTASKDAYVLLDAQDWMTDTQLNTLWDQITRTAAPGARVIFRTGGADNILPGRVADSLLSMWEYQTDASRIGFENDRSAIYGGFHVYKLRG
ncbi:DUF3419 family protein [uncultured Roseobacter sp.]|uniref:DUF3419 family protein n=1 Tax=uncultured Roseobacter sp. TaxID=114847 RepID=UPI002602B524|nr:DUF3419 family protein [uncultured Roseobacter sp.]